MRSPVRFIILALLMFGIWLLLSGIYKPRLVITGLVVCVVVSWWVDWSRILDSEALPLELLPRGVVYWLWLAVEIFRSALTVTSIILHPRLPISPTLINFKASQETDVGLATHGNSITLTPGTITVGVSAYNDTIQVHALSKQGALDCIDSEMDKQVAWFEKALSKGG